MPLQILFIYGCRTFVIPRENERTSELMANRQMPRRRLIVSQGIFNRDAFTEMRDRLRQLSLLQLDFASCRLVCDVEDRLRAVQSPDGHALQPRALALRI